MIKFSTFQKYDVENFIFYCFSNFMKISKMPINKGFFCKLCNFYCIVENLTSSQKNVENFKNQITFIE